MRNLPELLSVYPQTGRVEWIGLRSAQRGSLRAVSSAKLEKALGLSGDHYSKPGGKRQITLIQSEHLAAIAALCGRETAQPELLRRNLVISGINLLALKGQQFYIGDALLEGTGLCEPCSRMEQALGAGIARWRDMLGRCRRAGCAGTVRPATPHINAVRLALAPAPAKHSPALWVAPRRAGGGHPAASVPGCRPRLLTKRAPAGYGNARRD